MSGLIRPIGTAVTLTALVVMLSGCRERNTLGASVAAAALAGALADPCVGDSLRPATAAPAQGLWSSGRVLGGSVAAMIGPPRPTDRTLEVTRPLETVEVSAGGDTIRHRVPAAAVSLEFLPPLGRATLGTAAATDSSASVHPAATYTLWPDVRLAAYEACATSSQGPRVRYLRRDGTGRIVTDVMLRRASEQ